MICFHYNIDKIDLSTLSPKKLPKGDRTKIGGCAQLSVDKTKKVRYNEDSTVARKDTAMRFDQMFEGARWIGTRESDLFPVFRRAFSVRRGLARARIRILGFGSYRFFINGVSGTDQLYLPLNSDFEERDFPSGERLAHRAYVNEFDVTHLVTEGENLLSVLLGNGWYTGTGREKPFGKRKLCYSLLLTYGDGESHVIGSSEEDRYCASYLRESALSREHHDYTLWNGDALRSNHIPSPWQTAVYATPVETDYLPADCPPDRVTERLTPRLIREGEGFTLWDAGKNIAGFPSLLCLADGDLRVTLGEELTEDGALDPKHVYGQEFRVTGAHKGQTVAPEFTWFGFRYFKLEGAARPTEVCVAHTDVTVTSSFASDDGTLNWIYDTYINTQLCNMHGGIPSDCPHIERRGYTGDGQITCRAAMKALDMKDFYRKWIADISDCQDRQSGHVQYTAPYTHSGGGPGGWGCAIVILPYEYWKHYGDDTLARALYPQMLRYFEYLEAHSENGLIVSDREGEWCLGDWCTPDPLLLPPPFVNNYYYIVSMQRVIEMARRFGHEEDVPLLERRIEERKRALNAAYFNPHRHTFLGGVQGADAFALDLGLGDEKTEESFLKRYEALGYYDTGIFGTDVVTRLLFERGRGDLALRLLTAESPHGFGAWKKDGATTFREYWGTSRSHSHPMFGSVVCYLFEYLLGIRQPEGEYGYRKLLIDPSGAVSAKGSMKTPRGAVSVDFRKDGDASHLILSLPRGTEAEVVLPSGERRILTGPLDAYSVY